MTNNDGEGVVELFQNNAVVEFEGIVCKYKDNKIGWERTVVLS